MKFCDKRKNVMKFETKEKRVLVQKYFLNKYLPNLMKNVCKPFYALCSVLERALLALESCLIRDTYYSTSR